MIVRRTDHSWSRLWALLAVLVLSSSTATDAQKQPSASVWGFTESKPLVALDGMEYRTEDLHGRYVLLDFWATWCAPCLEELPNFKAITTEFSQQQLLLLSISVDQTDRRSLLSFIRRHAMAWPQLHDNRGMKGPIAKKFAVDAVPRTVLVDRQGRVIAIDLRGEELLATLRALLAS